MCMFATMDLFVYESDPSKGIPTVSRSNTLDRRRSLPGTIIYEVETIGEEILVSIDVQEQLIVCFASCLQQSFSIVFGLWTIAAL